MFALAGVRLMLIRERSVWIAGRSAFFGRLQTGRSLTPSAQISFGLARSLVTGDRPRPTG